MGYKMNGDKLSTGALGLAYGDMGHGFRTHVRLKAHSIDNYGNVFLERDAASEGELNSIIDTLIQELERVRKYGKDKFMSQTASIKKQKVG